MQTEKQIEQKLIKEVKNLGGLPLKFISPNTSGVPDRLVFMPEGRLYLVEVKSSAGKLSKTQRILKRKFEGLGFRYFVISSYEEVEEFINAIYPA